MSFSNLNLSSTLLKALDKSGYQEPTEIQALAIPHALKREDVVGVAQTGTGKTAAYVLPALQFLIDQGTDERPVRDQKPRVLILAPVRELAAQITDAIYKYSSYTKYKVASIVGGMPYQAQMKQLSKPLDIIVATPGRLMDYIERGNVDLRQIQMLILDEADRMLDMGFIDDIKHISQYLPKDRQTLFFTATMNQHTKQLASRLLKSPVHVQQENVSVAVDKIEQTVYLANDIHHKKELLNHILAEHTIFKAIIFCSTKMQADRLTDELRDMNFAAAALHGDIRQQKRTRILSQFKSGRIHLLVGTDVLGRGIDVPDVTHVINFDLPNKNSEEYVHRIGRCGRAGREGCAISLVSAEQVRTLKDIEHYIKAKIKRALIEGLEPKFDENSMEKRGQKAKPAKNKRAWNNNNGPQRSRRESSFSSAGRGDNKPAFSARRGEANSSKRSDLKENDRFGNSFKAPRDGQKFAGGLTRGLEGRPARFSRDGNPRSEGRPARFSQEGNSRSEGRPARFSQEGNSRSEGRPARFSQEGNSRSEGRPARFSRDGSPRSEGGRTARFSSEGNSRSEGRPARFSRDGNPRSEGRPARFSQESNSRATGRQSEPKPFARKSTISKKPIRERVTD